MRLVDVTDIEKFIRENACVIGDDHLLLVAGDDGRWHEALPLIKTAYDIGKVAEELEKESFTTTDTVCGGIFNAIRLSSAIEIVKQGGVSNDVCEWKFEETNGIAWHCDDKCTTYNQVYIKDLKITLEDFECKCPYCGKKIKVVE